MILLFFFLALLLGGVPEAFDVLFRIGLTLVFSQTLTLSQVTNISKLVGINSGSPLFRLVVDIESNSLLTVSILSFDRKSTYILIISTILGWRVFCDYQYT
jgi:hypothetical protein